LAVDFNLRKASDLRPTDIFPFNHTESIEKIIQIIADVMSMRAEQITRYRCAVRAQQMINNGELLLVARMAGQLKAAAEDAARNMMMSSDRANK
jgi:hypothetical protein